MPPLALFAALAVLAYVNYGENTPASTRHDDRLNSMFRLTNGSEDWLFAFTADDERIMEYRVGGGAWRTALRDLDGKILREYRTEQGGWTASSGFPARP